MLVRALVFAVLFVSIVGCNRHSYRIRQQYDRGRYSAAIGRCQMDSTAAAGQWNAGHRARYHVYCGMAYLGLGDSEHAAVELVQAERMRQQHPRLVTGRDLARLNQGLIQLFGVPAGQLSIEERPGAVAEAPAAPPVTVVPAPPAAPSAPSVMVSGSVSAGFAAGAAPAIPDDEEPAVSVDEAPATPPVIVIPEEEGAVIE